MADTRPILYVVAGPNGAGKLTLTAKLRESRSARIIDPDAIAREIAPDNPEKAAVAAGREAVRQRRQAIKDRESVVLETTLSGVTLIGIWRLVLVANWRFR